MRKQMRFVTVLILLFAAQPALRAAAADPAQASVHRPVSSREVDQLKQEILDETRSSVEGLFEYHNETGDLNNRLDFLRYGGRLNYKWTPHTMLSFRGVRTSYMTIDDFLNEAGTNFTVGLRSSVSEAVTAQFEAGATRFSTEGTSVNALGSLRFKPSQTSSISITGSRNNVEETLLSATGVRPVVGPFAGKLVGQVMDNRIRGDVRFQLFPRLELFGNGAAGTRTGQNIDSNFFKQAGGGVGYNIYSSPDNASVTLLQASYVLDYFGFDKDLLGFGGASLLASRGRPVPLGQLGGVRISPVAGPGRPGAGGYFSPARFVSNVGRLELQGRPDKYFEYRLAGFIGAQSFTGSDLRQAAGGSATLSIRLSDRFSLPLTYLRDNVGPFTQQSLFFGLVARL